MIIFNGGSDKAHTRMSEKESATTPLHTSHLHLCVQPAHNSNPPKDRHARSGSRQSPVSETTYEYLPKTQLLYLAKSAPTVEVHVSEQNTERHAGTPPPTKIPIQLI